MMGRDFEEKLKSAGVLERLKYLEAAECRQDKNLEDIKSKFRDYDEKIRNLQTMEQNLRDAEKKLKEEEEKNKKLEKEKQELVEQYSGLQTFLDDCQREKSGLEKSLQEANEKAEGLERRQKDLEDENAWLAAGKEAVEQELRNVRGQLDARITEYEELTKEANEKIESANKTIEGLQADCRKKDGEISEKGEKIATLNESLSDAKSDIDERNHMIAQLEDKNRNLASKLDDTESQLEGEKTVTGRYRAKFAHWEEYTEKYRDLLETLFQCKSLAVMMDDYNLVCEKGADDVGNIIRFAGLLGNQLTFLPVLYDYLQEDKEKSKAPISLEEKALFNKLNLYYKGIFGEAFLGDVIRYPRPGDAFNKASMKDIDNRASVYRTVEEVYVPAITRDGGADYLQLALVKGA